VTTRRKPSAVGADARPTNRTRRPTRGPRPGAGPDGPSPAEGSTEAEAGWRARVVGRSLAPAADKAVRRGQQLISAASGLVLRSGGDDFTVQQVAAEAGLTLRAFYQHFTGKDDLLIALIEESQLVLARLLHRHADPFELPLERIGGALAFSLDVRQHTPAGYNAALMRYVQRTALVSAERVAAARRPVVAVFTRLIDDAMVAGVIERGDPERQAFALMALTVSYSRVAYLGNDLCSRLPSTAEFVRFCVHGLGARLELGWEHRFELSDAEAAASRREAERIAADSLRRPDSR
jgi:AcrR family transcriptional regulator